MLKQLLNIPHNHLVLHLEKYCFENISCKMLNADRSLVDSKIGKFVFSSVECFCTLLILEE